MIRLYGLGVFALFLLTLGFPAACRSESAPSFLFAFGSQGTGVGEFFAPTGIALDDSGNVYGLYMMVLESGWDRIARKALLLD